MRYLGVLRSGLYLMKNRDDYVAAIQALCNRSHTLVDTKKSILFVLALRPKDPKMFATSESD